MIIKKRIALFAFLLLLSGGAGFSYWKFGATEKAPQEIPRLSQPSIPSPSSITYENIFSLQQRSAYPGSVAMDNPDLPAPTNQWFSSLAFKENGEPLFVYPWALKMTEKGFGLSVPRIVSTPDTVYGSYSEDLEVVLGEDLRASIGTYDDLSTEIISRFDGVQKASLRVTRGSPFVFVRLAASQQAVVVRFPSLAITYTESGTVLLEGGEKTIALFYNPEEMELERSENGEVRMKALKEGSLFTLTVLPSSQSRTGFAPYALDPIVKTSVSASRNEDGFFTVFDITTLSGAPTLLGLLPRHYEKMSDPAASASLGSYATLRGEQRVYAGKSFSFNQSVILPMDGLDLSVLESEERKILLDQVLLDAKTLAFPEPDTYFVGKKIYAAANLLDIARKLGADSAADIIQEKLKSELTAWRQNSLTAGAEEKYFYYDRKIGGIVGVAPSFGSELFNDHHFHYGYFIYAASILSRYDEGYLAENRDFINLLVKDIMNDDRADTNFPYLRSFDQYEGHSWASGFGIFADGNNQESSSEAVNAWYATYLWAKAIENPDLEQTAAWLYSQESDSALRYWLNIDSTDERFQKFEHPSVSLVWGGKLDYATWFSALPEAALGIQLLPLNAGSTYLASDKERILRNLSGAPIETAKLFRDFLIMYEAMADPAKALEHAASLAPSELDNVNTLSYFKAWLFTQKHKENR